MTETDKDEEIQIKYVSNDKICSKCGQTKSLQEFHRDRYRPDGFSNACKTCRLATTKKWINKNIVHVKNTKKLWYENNRLRELERFKKYNIEHAEQKKVYRKKYREDNKEKFKIRERERYLKNPRKEYRKEYEKNRRANDIQYRISCRLRIRLWHALKGRIKLGSAIRDLGCTLAELKIYFESKFQAGMAWDNYGLYSWHIDHIIPLSSFDLSDPEQIKKACHYTNLQPLWAKDNLSKGAKIEIDRENIIMLEGNMELLNKLAKLSDDLDLRGFKAESNQIDVLIKKIAGSLEEKVKKLEKNAKFIFFFRLNNILKAKANSGDLSGVDGPTFNRLMKNVDYLGQTILTPQDAFKEARRLVLEVFKNNLAAGNEIIELANKQSKFDSLLQEIEKLKKNPTTSVIDDDPATWMGIHGRDPLMPMGEK